MSEFKVGDYVRTKCQCPLCEDSPIGTIESIEGAGKPDPVYHVEFQKGEPPEFKGVASQLRQVSPLEMLALVAQEV